MRIGSDYAAGVVIQSQGQAFRKDGTLYLAAPGTTLPYTLTGIWANEESKFSAVGAGGDTLPTDGAIGQVLVKTSETEYGWRNPPPSTKTLNITNVFTKNPFGRLRPLTPLANTTTVQTIMEFNADFVGVRVGIPNVTAAAQAGVKVSIAVTNELKIGHWYSHPYSDGGWFRNLTWFDCGHGSPDGTSVTLPPRIAPERQSVTYSDLIGITSIPRVEEGKTKPLLMIRIEFPAGTTMSCPYTGFYNWRLDGEHPTMRVSKQEVAGVTTPSNYTTTTSIDDEACIPIVQYISPREGHQIMLVGDSTTEGLGGIVRDYGAIQAASNQLSTKEYPIEYYNCGLHAQGPQVYSNQFNDYVDEVLPSIVFYQPYSINDTPNGGMNLSTYSNLYMSLSRVMRQAKDKGRGAMIFLLEGLPCNTNFRDTGAGDQLRRDLNVWLQTFTGAFTIPGYAAAISGEQDVDGQTLIADGMTDDGVHPNGAGYDAMAQVIKPYIKELLPIVEPAE